MAISLRTDGTVAFEVNSYDDLEDSIHELADELWKAADAVASNEPLAAKQFLEDATHKWNALSQYINNQTDQGTDK